MNKKDLDIFKELYSSVYNGDSTSQEGPEVLNEVINTQTPAQIAAGRNKVNAANSRAMSGAGDLVKKLGTSTLKTALPSMSAATSVALPVGREALRATAAQNAAGPRQTKGAPVAKPTAATKPQFGTTTPKGSSVTSTGVSGLSAADRSAYSAGGGNAAAQKGMGSSTAQVIAQGKKNLGRMDQGKPAPPGSRPTSGSSSVHSTTGLSAYSAGSGSGSGGSSSSGGAAKPAAAPTAPVKPAASAVPKPAASSANPMDTWARSNPGLARKVANSSTPQAGKSVISARVNADNDRGPSTPTPSSSSSTTSGSSSSSGETDRLKKALDIKKSDVTSSYQWPSAKTIRDIAGAYASIYEAKKKDYDTSRDKDGDGDNDFADNMIARMVASGMSREEAIKKVKNKSYNEEIEYIEERDEGKPGLMFKKIAAKAAKKYGSKEAGNRVAGAIRKKVLANEATAMAKRGYDETAIRNKIAKSTGGGEAADRATALANKETFGRGNKAARQKYAATQRGDFRDTTSSNSGLHGYAHKSNDPAVKAKQAARGAQRSALTPREKKQLNREAYEAYEFVASYLLENNFASTVDDANVIINNMSENWFASIMEEKKPLPVAKMKRKESKLLDNEEGQLQALRTDFGSKERKARIKELERFDNINGVRTSVAKRGGKQQHPMPEVGRFKPKDED